jgi:deoxyribodipyrimidine photolyase-related protein
LELVYFYHLMQSVSLIFPHQLFEHNLCVAKGRPAFLIEEFLYFKQYNFHKQKLLLHRASMRFYWDNLIKITNQATYISCTDNCSDVRVLIKQLSQKGIKEIHITDVVDNWLQRRIQDTASKYKIAVHTYPSPMFICNMHEVEDFFASKKTFFQTDFYIWQRKQLNILVTEDKKPIGGKWTYDADNRQKYPTGQKPPSTNFLNTDSYYAEAEEYVQEHFGQAPGSQYNAVVYPHTYKQAQAWLQQFLEQRFNNFGIYEDAIVSNENILNHSVLTPMLNIGLLTPQYIIEQTLAYASANPNLPLNSVEGFVRQIIGWREFIRAVYELKGSTQRTTNYWGFKRKIPASFYNGTTGIAPIDDAIHKLLQTGYNHHIERLMLLGNFMLLCEFSPNQVYQWFMEMYIDAYDWVMVPNIYGMTQFADGGIMTTKPYISGSNYIIKMSNYSKTENWCATWDALFWHFMQKQEKFFSSNPRLGMLLGTWHKMDEGKKQNHLKLAKQFFNKLDSITKAAITSNV